MVGLVGSYVFVVAYMLIALGLFFLLNSALRNDTCDMDTENIWGDYHVSKKDMNF